MGLRTAAPFGITNNGGPCVYPSVLNGMEYRVTPYFSARTVLACWHCSVVIRPCSSSFFNAENTIKYWISLITCSLGAWSEHDTPMAVLPRQAAASLGRPVEEVLFQSLEVKLVPQVDFGGDQYRIVILQAFQYLYKDSGIMTQPG